jgi:hypothetical protein
MVYFFFPVHRVLDGSVKTLIAYWSFDVNIGVMDDLEHGVSRKMV